MLDDTYAVFISSQPDIVFFIDIDVLDIVGYDRQGFGVCPVRADNPFLLPVVYEKSVLAGGKVQSVILFQYGADGIVSQFLDINGFQTVGFRLVDEKSGKGSYP